MSSTLFPSIPIDHYFLFCIGFWYIRYIEFDETSRKHVGTAFAVTVQCLLTQAMACSSFSSAHTTCENSGYTTPSSVSVMSLRPPSRSHKPLRLAYDPLRLASRLAAAYGGLLATRPGQYSATVVVRKKTKRTRLLSQLYFVSYCPCPVVEVCSMLTIMTIMTTQYTPRI